MKRALKILGIVVGVLVVAIVVVFVTTFAGMKAVVDGQELPGNARVVKDGYVNIFVLDAGGGALALIDAGNDREGKAILAELARRKATVDDVKAVFLTHGHPDHINGLAVLPKAEVYAMAVEQDFLSGKRLWAGPIPHLMAGKDSGVHLTHGLTDGEEVHLGQLVVTAYATPGHTEGSAVYVAGGVAFFGDSATGTSGDEIRSAPWMFSDDQPRNVASLKALATRLEPLAAQIQTLAFAHSGPLAGFGPLKAFGAAH